MKNLIVEVLAGSHAYGMATEHSDVDIRGIFCADPINVRTPFFPVREKVDIEAEDTKYYELTHYMKLYLECNPNIVEILWTDPEDVRQTSPVYDLLVQYRQRLLSTKIAWTTSGYAFAQLKRIKGHNKWLNNPQPKQCPKQKDFVTLLHNFSSDKLFAKDFELPQHNYLLIPYGHDVYGVIYNPGSRAYTDDGQLIVNNVPEQYQRISPLYLIKHNKQEYKNAKDKHTNYWNWRTNRNKTRSELEEKYGYDTKHAAHLIRLLNMGIETLTDGVVYVKRPDADFLLDIRNGALTYDELIQLATEKEQQLKQLYTNNKVLPKKPDVKLAATVLMEAQDMIWMNENE